MCNALQAYCRLACPYAGDLSLGCAAALLILGRSSEQYAEVGSGFQHMVLAEVWGHCLLCGIYCCLHKVVPLTTATAIATPVIAIIPYPRQSQPLNGRAKGLSSHAQ